MITGGDRVKGQGQGCRQGAPLRVALEQDLEERPGLGLVPRRRGRFLITEGHHSLALAAAHGLLKRLALLHQRVLRHHLRTPSVHGLVCWHEQSGRQAG